MPTPSKEWMMETCMQPKEEQKPSQILTRLLCGVDLIICKTLQWTLGLPPEPPTQPPATTIPPRRHTDNTPPMPAPAQPRREQAARSPVDLGRMPPLPERPVYRRTTAPQAAPMEPIHQIKALPMKMTCSNLPESRK
jgi:hypothetical protein